MCIRDSYAPAAANILKGFQTPEKVDREFATAEQLTYEDRSAGLRRESDEIARVQDANARNVSGGSAGNVRANKAGTSASRFRRKQSIDTTEMGRADQVQSINAQARQVAKDKNISLKQAYDEMDAQNAAAVDAYGEQGLADMDRIRKQKGVDKKLEQQQSLILDLLESSNFKLDKDNLQIGLK